MPETPKSLNVSLTPELTRFPGAERQARGERRLQAALRLLEREEAGMLPERLSTQPQLKRGQASDE